MMNGALAASRILSNKNTTSGATLSGSLTHSSGLKCLTIDQSIILVPNEFDDYHQYKQSAAIDSKLTLNLSESSIDLLIAIAHLTCMISHIIIELLTAH